MRTKALSRAVLAALTVCVTGGVAAAHVSLISGPAQANKSQKITFGVGHGCDGADTVAIRVTIPAGITSPRALQSDFGKPTVERDAADNITAITWTKRAADLLPEDFGYYEITMRARVADAPFTRILFNIDQTCRTPAGVETVVHWNEPPGSGGDEAAQMFVVPARVPGWNRVTLSAPIADEDLPVFFGDATIVWKGTAAYSSNATTSSLIEATAGVSLLTGGLAAADELWVKY
jgi:periplasmic copper chaperone A